MRLGTGRAALAAAVCFGLMGVTGARVYGASASAADELTLSPAPAPQAPAADQPLYLQAATTEPAAAGSPTPVADTPPKPDKPLTAALTKAGIKTGDIAIYGFVEGSYTYGLSSPPNNFIGGRVFDIDNQEVLLNQIDLSVEKTVDSAAAAKDQRFILGGKVEAIYGNDARFIHANGLNFYGGAVPQLSPENQADLVQAYVDFGLPVGNGLLIRAGKMVTHMGYETINPTTNPFYSHSFLFGYAIPFTHTGVMAFYNLTDKVTVMGGFSRGWDQSLKDNNDSLDYLGQVKWVITDKWTGYLNVVSGPEQDNNNDDWRTVVDGILTWTPTDHWSLSANGDFGWEGGAVAPAGNDYATWYGVAAYAGYKINDYLTLNVRGEWFNDKDGARGIGDVVYEGTVGAQVHPFPNSDIGQNFVIRPELRCDYSSHGIWDGGTDHTQWTAAIDAIFQF